MATLDVMLEDPDTLSSTGVKRVLTKQTLDGKIVSSYHLSEEEWVIADKYFRNSYENHRSKRNEWSTDLHVWRS